MLEAQTFIVLSMFLADSAEAQYQANLSGGFRDGSITCWPQAVQCLLRSYATARAEREALDHFRKIRQKEDKPEELY